MADAPETVTTLNGLFKEVYSDGIRDLIPTGIKVQKLIPYIEKQKEVGNQYHQPVILAYAQGFTHAGASAGAFALNSAAAGVMKDAALSPSQILLREQLDYESAARAAKGRNAFMDATALMFENMQKSMRKRLEVQLLHAGTDLGVVSSTTSTTITFTTATWAPGIWAGAEGANLDVWDTTLATQRTNSAVIVSVDVDNRKITIDALPTGTVATDRVFFKGAKGNEMSGIHAILANSGSLFGISASTYTLWKSTSYNASGALTFDKLKAAISVAVGKGLDEDCVVLVNPRTWDNLMSDLAALRRFVDNPKGKGSAYQIGAENIEYYSQNGKVSIMPSIYVKEGFAYGLVPEVWKRPGAADVTFKTPGYGDQIFFHLPTNAGFEVRSYTDQCVFSEAPAKNFLVTGIVNV